MMDSFWHVAAFVGSVIGATWVLRSKLGDIETALTSHVVADEERHAAQDAKIIKLETRRGRR